MVCPYNNSHFPVSTPPCFSHGDIMIELAIFWVFMGLAEAGHQADKRVSANSQAVTKPAIERKLSFAEQWRTLNEAQLLGVLGTAAVVGGLVYVGFVCTFNLLTLG